MIYFGDGETDVPCMKLIKQQGGNSIAVYKPRNSKKIECAKKLIQNNRVNFACPADYSKKGDIYKIVEAIIMQVKSNFDFRKLQNENQKKFEKKECGIKERENLNNKLISPKINVQLIE